HSRARLAKLRASAPAASAAGPVARPSTAAAGEALAAAAASFEAAAVEARPARYAMIAATTINPATPRKIRGSIPRAGAVSACPPATPGQPARGAAAGGGTWMAGGPGG